MNNALHKLRHFMNTLIRIIWILIKGYFYCLIFAPVIAIEWFCPEFPKSWKDAEQQLDLDTWGLIGSLFVVVLISGILWLFLIGVPFIIFGVLFLYRM